MPLGLSLNEVNDGLDELPVFLIHHLPGTVLFARFCHGDQMATCTKWCGCSMRLNWSLLTDF